MVAVSLKKKKKLVEEAQKAGVKEADKVLEDIAKLEAKK